MVVMESGSKSQCQCGFFTHSLALSTHACSPALPTTLRRVDLIDAMISLQLSSPMQTPALTRYPPQRCAMQ